jgi:hypothetical protein
MALGAAPIARAPGAPHRERPAAANTPRQKAKPQWVVLQQNAAASCAASSQPTRCFMPAGVMLQCGTLHTPPRTRSTGHNQPVHAVVPSLPPVAAQSCPARPDPICMHTRAPLERLRAWQMQNAAHSEKSRTLHSCCRHCRHCTKLRGQRPTGTRAAEAAPALSLLPIDRGASTEVGMHAVHALPRAAAHTSTLHAQPAAPPPRAAGSQQGMQQLGQQSWEPSQGQQQRSMPTAASPVHARNRQRVWVAAATWPQQP